MGNTHLSCQFLLLSALVYSLADFFKGNLSMSSTASELSASKVWVKDALQSFLPLSSSSILQSKPPSHHQSPSPSALVGLLENEKFLNPRYKTEICRNFKERSKCIYGDKCQFAHGRRELRDVIRNSKYKTKLCQKYWLVGYCAYGPRCNFLHYELEADEEFVEHQEVLTNIDDDNDPTNESIRIVEL